MRILRAMGLLVFVIGVWGVVLPRALQAGGAEPPLQSPDKPRPSQESASASPPVVEAGITLEPFFLIRKKGSKVWVERVIVDLELETAGPLSQAEFDMPAARQVLYEMLQAGDPESSIQTKMAAAWRNQGVRASEVRVNLSRDILIVR